MNILQEYDRDCNIPFYGFGAKLPPNYYVFSHCFAVNGNIMEPYCHKTKGLLHAYNECIGKIMLHGPSAHAKVIEYVVDLIS